MHSLIRRGAYAALMLNALAPPAALAARNAIEEIVVTARQRSETLQEAPVTVSALSSDDLERLAINDLQEIGQVMPNLRISYGSSGASSQVYLRGIGTGSGSAGFSSAVGILIDDVHFQRGRWIQQGFFDMKQVEVLKGPQALYFGKNNTAGLIILQTRDPGDTFEANVRAGYEANSAESLLEGGGRSATPFASASPAATASRTATSTTRPCARQGSTRSVSLSPVQPATPRSFRAPRTCSDASRASGPPLNV